MLFCRQCSEYCRMIRNKGENRWREQPFIVPLFVNPYVDDLEVLKIGGVGWTEDRAGGVVDFEANSELKIALQFLILKCGTRRSGLGDLRNLIFRP